MWTLADITAITVAYETPALLSLSYGSFRRFYPDVPAIVIDNSFSDRSREFNKTIARHPKTILHVCSENIGHGRGLDMGIKMASSKLCFIYDTDTEMHKPGALEWMLGIIAQQYTSDREFFAAGSIIKVCADGVKNSSAPKIDYIHPAIAIINKEAYLRGAPFIGHGAPALECSKSHQDEMIQAYPKEYMTHYWQGSTFMPGAHIR